MAGFLVSNGRILAADGQPFRGINVYDWQMSAVSTNAAGAPLTSVFPGINFVRLNCYKYNTPDYYDAFITQMSGLGIMVELENHAGPSGAGGNSGAWTGAGLATETAWYAQQATAWKNNPLVCFGSLNEPSGSAGDIQTEHTATYNAIRSAGSEALLMFCMMGGFSTNGFNPAVYATMTNVGGDTHFYGWVPGYSQNTGTIEQALAAQVANYAAMTTAAGPMAVLIGEYGNSTTGGAVDADGAEVVNVVGASGYSCIAWGWNPDEQGDQLVADNGQITAYGQQVAGIIAQGISSVSASPNETTITAGGTITDAAGNAWTITAGGQVAMNGTPDTTTAGVVTLAYVNGAIWQENTAKLWWGKTSATAAWLPAAGTTSPLPAPATVSVASTQAALAALGTTISQGLAAISAEVGKL